jgi:hypothetical protein
MAEPQRISFDPTPPKQGKPVKICYDFTGLGITQTTLEVSFDGTVISSPEVTPANPCVTIQVPSDAENILVDDLDGPSPDRGDVVEPA